MRTLLGLAAVGGAALYGVYNFLYYYEAMRKSSMCHFAEEHALQVPPPRIRTNTLLASPAFDFGTRGKAYVCSNM